MFIPSTNNKDNAGNNERIEYDLNVHDGKPVTETKLSKQKNRIEKKTVLYASSRNH